jgi:hypothetical protein
LAVAALLFAALLARLPAGTRLLPRQDAFIPIVDTIVFFSDLITAVLLYAQYSVVRSRGLLALAMGYLFTAIIIVPHLWTFPGVFTATGAPGAGLQSTAWLYIIWHLGLPLAAIGYALFTGRHICSAAARRHRRQPSSRGPWHFACLARHRGRRIPAYGHARRDACESVLEQPGSASHRS